MRFIPHTVVVFTSKMSMEGWWMVQTTVRPVSTVLRTVRMTMAAARASSPAAASLRAQWPPHVYELVLLIGVPDQMIPSNVLGASLCISAVHSQVVAKAFDVMLPNGGIRSKVVHPAPAPIPSIKLEIRPS